MKLRIGVAIVLGALAVASRGAQAGIIAPAGDIFPVNTYTTNAQDNPAVCGTLDGGFVVVWGGGEQVRTEIFGQRFASDGGMVGSEFQVNTYTTDEQERPAICCNDTGGFVVVWRQEVDQDGDEDGLFAQRFDSDNEKVGSEFQVNTYTTKDQTYPAICCNTGGSFIVTWASYEQDGDRYGIYAQRFTSSGMSSGTEFPVNTYTTEVQLYPAIACAANGDFTIAWQSDLHSLNSEVVARRYASDGMPYDDEFQVNTYTTGSQDEATICSGTNGDFVVAWESSNQDGSSDGVFGQRFDSAGLERGTEFQVANSTMFRQGRPNVSCDADGDFTVVWDGNITGGGYTINARPFAASGEPRQDEILINFPTIAYQMQPGVVLRDDESFVVVWEYSGGDGSGRGVFGRLLALPSPTPSATSTPTSTATAPPATATSTAVTATPTSTLPSATATPTSETAPTETAATPTRTSTTEPSPTGTLPTATSTPTGPTPTRTPTLQAPTSTSTTGPSATVTLAAATATPTNRPPTPVPTDTAVPSTCVGDCDGNGEVTVDELVRGVNIALEVQTIDRCEAFDSNGDDAVMINELVQGVNGLLAGCE